MADVVGVRGAACRGGREGSVDAGLVRRLRERLGESHDWQNARTVLHLGAFPGLQTSVMKGAREHGEGA
jgi:hypothetical protein